MAFSLLHELTVFSLFPIIIEDILQGTAAAAIDQQLADGGQFLERIVHGEKISQNPGYLLFTAPYKLCEGGCEENDEENFAMAFPIYIGKKGMEKYHEIYATDHKNVYSNKPHAPFRSRPTKKLFTLCPSKVTTKANTKITTEKETPAVETPSTTNMEKTDIDPTDDGTSGKSDLNLDATETITETMLNKDSENEDISSENRKFSTQGTQMPSNEITEGITLIELDFDTNIDIPSTTVAHTIKSSIEEMPITICMVVPSTKSLKTTKSKNHRTSKSTTRSSIIYSTALVNTIRKPRRTTNSEIITYKPYQVFETVTENNYLDSAEIPKTTHFNTDLTETENISFESYRDGDYGDSTFVTNAMGVRCPTKICRKKKVTASIIKLLVSKGPDTVRKITRNADWNSDYSNLQNTFDLY